MIKVEDFKSFTVGTIERGTLYAYGVHNNIGDALVDQLNRVNNLQQVVNVYGTLKGSGELITISTYKEVK